MKVLVNSIIIFIFSCLSSTAQESVVSELAYYADAALNQMQAEHRDYSDKKLYNIAVDKLNKNGIGQMGLDSIQSIYNLTAVDSSFTLISWKVELEKGDSRYTNFIVFADGNYVELIDGGNELLYDGEYAINQSNECLSALYYKMQPHYGANNEVDAYLLYGFRTYNQYEKVKILDVLNIENQNVSLGKEVFSKMLENGTEDIKTRLILRYGADSQVAFQYNPNTKMLIFDHLIPRMGRLEGQGPTMLPDGSYEAYFHDKGKWYYKSKLFDQISEKAPVPEPVLDKRPKSIFGKEKK